MNATDQFGFDDMLASAEIENAARRFERKTADLPGTMGEALPCFRELLERHNAAMLAADVDETMRLRDEAGLMAKKLDPENRGILANENAPGCVLERETAAAPGTVPIWGQHGDFTIEAAGMRVRIEMDGVFGIGSCFGYWPGFVAYAVDVDRPFLSETGYRSFLGVHGNPVPGFAPDAFARETVATYVTRHLKGRLLPIDPQWCREARS